MSSPTDSPERMIRAELHLRLRRMERAEALIREQEKTLRESRLALEEMEAKAIHYHAALGALDPGIEPVFGEYRREYRRANPS